MTSLPTVKEIAKRLNVSVSTVSRALSDNPRIGLRTKQRAQELAKELGYEPNAQAILFKQKKTHTIGVVIPYIREDFFSQAISGIETAATAHNYTILFGQSYDEIEREINVVTAMKKQRVDGLLISLSKQTNQYNHLESLKKYNIPVVYFDRVPPMPDVHKVFCNLYKGTVEMVGWLLSKGYRQIAFINGPDKLIASKERLQGFIEALSKHKLKVDMQLVEKTDFSKESTGEAMRNLLALKKRPQAIITFNEYVHMDAVQYASRNNVDIGNDIVFVSYANLSITSYMAFPPLASIEQFPYTQGEKAMQILIDILQGKVTEGSAAAVFHRDEISPSLMIH